MKFAIVRDPSAMDAAFRVGRLDGGSTTNSHVLSKERQAGYIRDLGDRVWFAQIKDPGATSGASGFNLLKPGPWNDVRVRKAIQLWIDKQASIDAFAGGFGIVGGVLNADSPFTSPDLLTWPGWNPTTKARDRAEAKRLLAEAGYARGFAMRYPCNRTGNWPDRCQFLQAQLAELGIDLQFQLLDPAAQSLASSSLDYDAYQVTGGGATITADFPEATEGALTAYSRSKFAFTKHEDPKIAAWYDQLSGATTFEERARIWREMERYVLLEQVYVVPLANPVFVVPYRSHLKGRIVPTVQLLNFLDFATVWLDK
jgi:ABC-type transport system substrate-binding protein